MPTLDFERRYDRLADALIPVETFIDQVRNLEGLPEYGLNIMLRDENDQDIRTPMGGLFTVPYPYEEPSATRDWIERYDGISSISKIQMETWIQAINDRVSEFTPYLVPASFIDQVDSEPNTAVILHANSGYIVPFSYSNTNGVDIVHTYYNLPSLLNLCYHRRRLPQNVAGLDRYIREVIREVIGPDSPRCGFYRFHYHFAPGESNFDIWNDDLGLIPISAGRSAVYHESEFVTICARLTQCYNEHYKVIVMP